LHTEEQGDRTCQITVGVLESHYLEYIWKDD